MQAVILLAGYGSRLKRDDIPHKSMLPFGDDTLLSRHLNILQDLNMDKTVLVLGHNMEAVKAYVRTLDLSMPVEFIDNHRYATTGNTLSLAMGLRGRKGDLLVMDGDVLYPRAVLADYLANSRPSSFAVTPVDIDDTEASKCLLRPDGIVESIVTKRDLTDDEKSKFSVAGEAIGFFQLNQELVDDLLIRYDREVERFDPTLWEIIFSEAAQDVDITSYDITIPGCIEIDTQEDYDSALALFNQNPGAY